MPGKIRVGILFGGRSAEHEVSLQSARNIIDAIDRNKYEVVLIGIDKKGQWHLNEESRFLLPTTQSELPELPEGRENLALVPGKQDEQLVALSGEERLGSLDVIFPVLHGPFGEDGTVQGLLKLANIAFVGAGVLGSAVGMDKDVMKRLLRDAGIPVARFIVANRYSREEIAFDYAQGQLGLPLFIKPANLGSSVGIHKVKDRQGFEAALRDAFDYDNKILLRSASTAANWNVRFSATIVRLHRFQARLYLATNFTHTKRNISMRAALCWKYRRSCRRRFRNASGSWLSKRFLCSAVREWRASISSCETAGKLLSTSSTPFPDSPE
jgi:D-alanine--D-alanine ligase